jgi:hypothetical protein
MKQMEGISDLLSEGTVKKLKSVSERLSIPEKEIVKKGVETYIQRLAGMEEELELIGFGMWKDRSEMSNSSKWVAELREKEWNRWR